MASSLRLLRADLSDLDRLAQWREQPHVRQWWGDPALESDSERLSDPRIRCWIVEEDGRPVAFVQDYDVQGWDAHPFAHLPPGSRGMDLFLVAADDLGRGLGTRVVAALVDRLLAGGVPAIGVDPHPDNIASIRCFEKVGFTRTAGPLDTRWGRAILMEIRPDARPR